MDDIKSGLGNFMLCDSNSCSNSLQSVLSVALCLQLADRFEKGVLEGFCWGDAPVFVVNQHLVQ